VTSLDLSERVAKLQGGDEVSFGSALLATGAMVNLVRGEGAQLDGIHYVRTFGNSDAIREHAREAERVVLVGGSYIACEVAASLTSIGKPCTLVMIEELPMSLGFGDEVGRWFDELLRSRGVEVIGAETVSAFAGDGRVEAVVTESGRRVECDMVVVGAGVRPDVTLARRAGLEIGDGIVCDAALQSSADGIFAAGDCCSYESEIHRRRLRVEHWDVALQQGRHAARGMLGERRPYRELPYFFSDLADWASLEYVGPASEWDEVVFRGERDAAEFSAWYLSGGRLVAALSIGRPDDLVHARRLVESGIDVSSEKALIADAETDLEGVGE
jgi:3-phenylpropionate/trans-cinnamate dioxygenase ferredoxin reductase subunit